MKVDGSVTTIERVTVDITAASMIDAMQKQWLIDIGQVGNYINQNGEWEEWTDTGHGSGITEIVRAATESEIDIIHAFKTLRHTKFSK